MNQYPGITSTQAESAITFGDDVINEPSRLEGGAESFALDSLDAGTTESLTSAKDGIHLEVTRVVESGGAYYRPGVTVKTVRVLADIAGIGRGQVMVVDGRVEVADYIDVQDAQNTHRGVNPTSEALDNILELAELARDSLGKE